MKVRIPQCFSAAATALALGAAALNAAVAADGPASPRAALPSAVPATLERLKLPRESFDLGTYAARLAYPDDPAMGVRTSRGMFSRLTPDETLPRLGTEGPRVRVQSPLESFARRAHQEGVPLARLFENRSMLVSVGLNPRGKFGLWLIQKLP
jgi:hypothetical protein